MALKSRAPRKARTPKRRAPKSRAMKQPRRKPATSGESGIIETALAAFAHEVRTPLTGILAVSDLLATSDLGERERRWVETIKASAEHLAGLATLFVDAARSRRQGDNAGHGVRQDFFDLRALASSVGDDLARGAGGRGA